MFLLPEYMLVVIRKRVQAWKNKVKKPKVSYYFIKSGSIHSIVVKNRFFRLQVTAHYVLYLFWVKHNNTEQNRVCDITVRVTIHETVLSVIRTYVLTHHVKCFFLNVSPRQKFEPLLTPPFYCVSLDPSLSFGFPICEMVLKIESWQ